MVLYFVSYFSQTGRYPHSMLDSNIASDYAKLRKMFHLYKPEDNFQTIQKLLDTGEISTQIVEQFSFEIAFNQDQFSSLLFYMGMLSIKKEEFGIITLQMPNYVIKGLYLDFMMQLMKERVGDFYDDSALREMIIALARDGDVQPFVGEIQKVMKALSNRDSIKLSEKHLKTIVVALLYNTRAYYVKSEYETEKKYVDIALLQRLPVAVNYQYAIELKYLPKKEAAKKSQVLAAAITQLEGYLTTDALKNEKNLLAFVLMIVDDTVEMVQVK
jgi:hypothetical protein